MNYLKVFFGKMLNSTGRTSRGDFWLTMLWLMVFNMLFGMVVALIGTLIKLPTLLAIVSTILMVVIYFATFSMQIRRLHDTNKSGWYLLLNFIPFIGQIIILVAFLTPGYPLANNYGEPNRIA